MKEAQERARGCAPCPSLSCPVGGSTPSSSLLRCRCWRCRPRHDAGYWGHPILDPAARPGSTSIGTRAAPKTLRARQRDPPFLHFPLSTGLCSVKPNVMQKSETLTGACARCVRSQCMIVGGFSIYQYHTFTSYQQLCSVRSLKNRLTGCPPLISIYVLGVTRAERHAA